MKFGWCSTFLRIVSNCIVVLAFLVHSYGCGDKPISIPKAVLTVEVQPAVPAPAVRDLRLSGALAAEKLFVSSFSLMGTVEQVLVEEGDEVVEGQPIAKLSKRTYEDVWAMSKAKLDQAEDAYRRLEPMYRNKTLPEVKMVEVETGVKEARISVAMARRNIDDTVLRAAHAGTVARKHVDAGTNVTPGMPVVTLVQVGNMLAAASVPEASVSKVRKGDPAKVFVPATGATIDGVVKDVAIIADPFTRTYEVKVRVPNDGSLHVGMVSEVIIQTPASEPIVSVPPAAVRIDEKGRNFVYVLNADNTVSRRTVSIAGYVAEGIGIVEGLKEREMVVVSGTPMLADGLGVRVSGAKKATPDTAGNIEKAASSAPAEGNSDGEAGR